MKTSTIILTMAGIGLAYLYFTSKNGKSRKDNPYEKPVEGKKVNSDYLLVYYLEYKNILKERIGIFDPLSLFKNKIWKK
jgi:hypothetical protein